MESKDKLKETGINNRTCYYFDYVIKDVHTYLSDILLNEKLYKKYFSL